MLFTLAIIICVIVGIYLLVAAILGCFLCYSTFIPSPGDILRFSAFCLTWPVWFFLAVYTYENYDSYGVYPETFDGIKE